MLKIDNTKRKTYVSCPRKYFFEYILGLKTEKGSTPLRYGIVWHDMMEAFYKSIKELGWTGNEEAMKAAIVAGQKSWDEYTGSQEFWVDYRTLENAVQSFLEYINHYVGDEGFMEIEDVESIFQIETHWSSEEEEAAFPSLKPFMFTGKKDLMVRLNDQPWIYEHKTSGWPIKKVKQDLHRSPQVMGYTWAGKIEYPIEEPAGVLVSYHHLSCYKRKDGSYGNPKIDFERVPQIYTNEDLDNWRQSFLSTVERIQIEMDRNIWPMGHDSCYQYGRCSYCNICEMNKDIHTLIENVPYGYYITEPWDVTNEKHS